MKDRILDSLCNRPFFWSSRASVFLVGVYVILWDRFPGVVGPMFELTTHR